jgi:hypothetical protein
MVWVEGEPGLAGARGRGMMVVGHGPDPVAMKRSLVISYPLGAGGERQCLHAVSGALQKLGWSVVTFRRRKTAKGRANTAILVNQARSGGEQRLLLAEPVQAVRQRPVRPVPHRRSYKTRRAAVARLGRLTGAGRPARKVRGLAGARVNEGGAGDGAAG